MRRASHTMVVFLWLRCLTPLASATPADRGPPKRDLYLIRLKARTFRPSPGVDAAALAAQKDVLERINRRDE